MSTDLKHDSSANLFPTYENSSTEISLEHPTSPSSSTKHTRSESQSPKPIVVERPISPQQPHRVSVKTDDRLLPNRRRTRSNSPRKTFSYLPPDRLNLRQWKQQRRQIVKQQEDDRIYYENRQKLERLAKIAKEPSSYPTINLEQERQRDRHVYDYHRKLLLNYIPILEQNLRIVERLANVKGVYDRKQMEKDFIRHQQILKQDTVNRQKARQTADKQRPFVLPKINVKS